MNKLSLKKLLLYKVIAVVILLFLISFLRYCSSVKLFCGQNSSIFEITKIVFWAVLIYGFIEFLIPDFGSQDNIFFAKLTSVVAAPVLVAILLAILPAGFTMSLIAVTLAVIITQVAEGFLVRVQPNCVAISVVTLLFLIFLVCFIVFSYHPLGGVLFRK